MNKNLFLIALIFLCAVFISCQNAANKTTNNNYTVDTSTTYELQDGLQAYNGSVDTFTSIDYPTFDFSTYQYAYVSASSDVFLYFDTSMIPQDKTVSTCQLCMAVYETTAVNPVLNIYKITSAWLPASVSYNSLPAVVYHSSITTTADYKMHCYDLQNLMAQGWITNPGSNNGIMLNTSGIKATIATSESAPAGSRPMLKITVK